MITHKKSFARHVTARTYVSIDGFVRGTGTASCGQDTLMKYRFVLDDTIEFRFAMKPITR